MKTLVIRAALLGVCLSALATSAFADATAFIGLTTEPAAGRLTGAAIGSGLLVVGFEFEYAHTQERLEEAVPSLRTFMGTLLVQTPVPIHGLQFYGAAGGGLYRESLAGLARETNIATSVGGGVKVSVAGPVRLRLDYRVLLLRGSPAAEKSQRFYAGLNLAF